MQGMFYFECNPCLFCVYTLGWNLKKKDAIKEAKISKLNEAMTNKFVVCVYGRPYISQSAKDRLYTLA